MDDKYIKGKKLNSLKYPTELKCPVVILLDTSNSMAGEKINSLNSGINLLINTLKNDEIAHKRVELSIVSFNSVVDVIQDFAVVDDIYPVELNASGSTSMGEAILKGIDLISKRKEIYKSNGIDYNMPVIWLITDGEPTDIVPNDDMWKNVVKSVHEGERQREFAFLATYFDGADISILAEISIREPVKLNGINFKDVFLWLCDYSVIFSYSSINDIILSPPNEWGTIDPDK